MHSLTVSFGKKDRGRREGEEREGLVVSHVSRSRAELGVGFDDFVHGFKEIFLCGDFPASSDGEHSCLRAHAPDLRTWTTGFTHRFSSRSKIKTRCN